MLHFWHIRPDGVLSVLNLELNNCVALIPRHSYKQIYRNKAVVVLKRLKIPRGMFERPF